MMTTVKIFNNGILLVIKSGVYSILFKEIRKIDINGDRIRFYNDPFDTTKCIFVELDNNNERQLLYQRIIEKWGDFLNRQSYDFPRLAEKLDKLLDHIDILPDGKEYNEVKEKFANDVVKNDL